MKLARLTCPGCRNPYELPIDREDFVAECPTCGQRNTVSSSAELITGLCRRCSRPLDDHIWQGDIAEQCP